MHTPRKRFGQHFLSDQDIIARIIALLQPNTHDHFLEIGPGQGALTVPMLKETHYLEVVELDRDLIPQLETRCRRVGELKVYAGDALAFDFASVKNDDRLLRIFGNLPYNISTPLFFHLLTFSASIADMLFMVQKEVAERMAAAVNAEHYGRLSVMAQYHCKIEALFTVPAEAFYPPPQVISQMLRLTPYHELPHRAKNYGQFAFLVKQAFGQRRKTLRNSLKGIISDADWEQLQVRSDQRPENISVQEFVEMSNMLVRDS